MVTELDAAATQQFSQLAADAAKTSREALDSTAEVIKKFQNLGDREGISLLEVKNRDLLAYVREMCVLMCKMSCGGSIQGDEAILRNIKHRVVLERVRLMEKKMQSQIERVCQTGREAEKQSLRARPHEMQLDDDEEVDDEEEKVEEETTKSKKYVPPKVMAVHYDEREVARDERKMELLKKRALQSSLVQELRQQYSDAPEEIMERRSHRRAQDKERISYEEDYMMRMQLNKKERSARKKEERENALDSLLHFGDYMAGDEEAVKRKEAAAKGGRGLPGRKRAISRGGPKPKMRRGGGAGGRGRGSSRGSKRGKLR